MTNPTDELRALIQAGSGASTPPGTAAERASTRALAAEAELRTLAQQAHAGPQTHTSPAASTARKRLLTGVVAVALLLGAAALWRAMQPAPSGPAATLQQLAQGVEQYRHSRNGSLPEQLSKLEQFPQGAVEWQLPHWKARDAAGRTEIMLAPNGPAHYRLVLRQGSQVWIYSDQDRQARQTHK